MLTVPVIAANGARSTLTMPDPVISTGSWPDASTTGYGNTVLVPATTNSLNVPGATYSGLHFTGVVTISASNVTLSNCLITANPADPWSLGLNGTLTEVVVKNVTIIGAGKGTLQSSAAYGFYVQGNVGVTFDACDISQVGQNAINDGNIVVKNCYIHDLNSGPGTHYECIYYGGAGGTNPNFSLDIEHNTLNNQRNNAAMYVANDFGAINNVTINNNLLIDSNAAGSFTCYVDGALSAHSITNVAVTNNALLPGQYGYFLLRQGLAPVYQVTKSGNYDYITKAPV